MSKLYGTNISDAAWALIEPHLPAPMSATVHDVPVSGAIVYLLRTERQWRRRRCAKLAQGWRRNGVWRRPPPEAGPRRVDRRLVEEQDSRR